MRAFTELSPEMDMIIARARPRYTEEQIQKVSNYFITSVNIK